MSNCWRQIPGPFPPKRKEKEAKARTTFENYLKAPCNKQAACGFCGDRSYCISYRFRLATKIAVKTCCRDCAINMRNVLNRLLEAPLFIDAPPE